jgi:hypothetical protein
VTDPRDPARRREAQAETPAERRERLARVASRHSPRYLPAPPPRLPHAVIGYRCWELDPVGRLWPVNDVAPEPWRPGTNEAYHEQRYNSWITGAGNERVDDGGHDVPGHGCVCGLYVRHDPNVWEYDQFSDPARRAFMVVGAVAVWGRLEAHYDGVRARYARIVALALPDAAEDPGGERAAVVDRAARRYDVPAVPRDALAFEAGRYGDPLPADLRPPKPPQPVGEYYMTTTGMIMTNNYTIQSPTTATTTHIVTTPIMNPAWLVALPPSDAKDDE